MWLLRNKHYVTMAIWATVAIILSRLAFEWEAVPFEFGQFLYFHGAFWEPFVFAWPLFLLGFSINFYKMSTSINPPEVHKNANQLPLSGFLTSLMAGIMEELTFRWTLFFGCMGLFYVIDSLLLDNILRNYITERGVWINVLATLRSTPYAYDHKTWTIGLAVLASNWKFQEGHIYQGKTGWIMSGIGGLFFFAIMFRYGLFASMLVHFTFDMLVFIMLIIDVQLEKAMGIVDAHGKIYKWY